MEPVYHEAEKAIISHQAKTPATVFELLRPIYVSDHKFELDFATLVISTNGQRKKLAKYILSMLESYRSGRRCDPETDPTSIEHILPENSSQEWEQTFPQSQWEAAVYRLGNLTLLRAVANRRASNAGYREKVSMYRQSAYQLTKDIAELAPAEWTMELIERRQRDLARIATMV